MKTYYGSWLGRIVALGWFALAASSSCFGAASSTAISTTGSYTASIPSPDDLTTTGGSNLQVTGGTAQALQPDADGEVSLDTTETSGACAVFTGRLTGWGCFYAVEGVWTGGSGGTGGTATKWHSWFDNDNTACITLEVNGPGPDDNYVGLGGTGTLTVTVQNGVSGTYYIVDLSCSSNDTPAGNVTFSSPSVTVAGGGDSQTVIITGDAIGDLTITGTASNAATGTVPAGVIQANLFVDTNNDGTIDTDLSAGHEHSYAQYPPGVVVCKDRAGDGDNLDQLVAMDLSVSSFLATGVVTLQATTGGSLVKIWTDASKTTEVTLPKTYNLGSDMVPSTLWIDGIETGQVMLQLSYANGGAIICSDQVAVFVTDTVSWSPSGKIVYAWEPCGWPNNGHLITEDADAVLNNVKDQGWDVTTCRFVDTAGSDNVGTCTLANFKDMKNGGIVVWNTHGEPGFIGAVYCEDRETIVAWIGHEKGMYALKSDYWGYAAEVGADWMSTNWKPTLDNNKAIVFAISCNSADGTPSVFQSAGGRVAFGETGSHMVGLFGRNAERLLGRMNGSRDNGRNRTAGKAYEAGHQEWFKMVGNGSDDTYKWTTLCPAPAVNGLFPNAPAGNRQGAGVIIFDTYMNDSVSANDAVIQAAGTATISDRRWLSNGSGMYLISFDFDSRSGGGATMTAKADKCLNAATIGRQLDGNRVKPNGDDASWSF